MKTKKDKKIDYDFDWLEYQITFKCKCGKELTIDDNEEEYNTTKCPKCKRKYYLSVNIPNLKEVKNK